MRLKTRTARRPGAEFAVNLSKRRRWFAGEGGEGEQPDPPAADDGGEAIPDWVKDPDRAYAEIKRVRDEAAQNRKALKELQAAETKRQKEQQTAKDAELAEQGKYKDLLDKEKAEREKAEAELATLRRAALAREVADEVGIPATLAARLQGDDKEAMLADAEALKKELGLDQKPDEQQPARGRTTTPATPGGRPVGETDEQRRTRIYGHKPDVFGGGVVYADFD